MTKYNVKEIENVGKHDFQRFAIEGLNVNFSVGVFKWEIKGNGKEMKKSKAIVRISGKVADKEKVFAFADNVVKDLDEGMWDGRKTVFVK